MVDGRPPPPIDFHTRKSFPETPTNGVGSIEPPRSGWHSNGALVESVKGPCGLLAVATEMHWILLPAVAAV